MGLRQAWLDLKFHASEWRYAVFRRVLPYLVGDPKTCEHEWWVVSTVLTNVSLDVQCYRCGTYGNVRDPTAAEWSAAYHAPSEPYRWTEPSRVASSLSPISDYLPP